MDIFDIHTHLTTQHVQELFEQTYAKSTKISINTNGYGGYEIHFFGKPKPSAHACFDINSPHLQLLIKNNPLTFNADILRECPQHLKDIVERQEA